MIIKNGLVLTDNFSFEKIDIFTENSIIKSLGNENGCDINAENCYIIPGLIDTHFHGMMGESFLGYTEDTFSKIASFTAKNGTTTIVPAISAAPKEVLLDSIEYANKYINKEFENCSKMVGIHLEGPFFSESYKGAHLPENIRNPKAQEFMEYANKANGNLKIITMAPELPGADEVIKCAAKENVCVSVGHTDASSEDVKHAAEIGAKQCTHLFNAMRGLNRREPGTVGGALSTNMKVELICDFFHVHPDVIRFVYRLKGADKINMITDSVAGFGLPDGEYFLDGSKKIVRNKHCYTENGTTIAGGSSNLIDGIRNLVSIDIPLEDAVKMATKNPAETVGIYDKVGSITPGKQADILILNKDLSINKIILRGKVL
ncbi:MAG: N-acetylglucosamine-6-phosphate deacetylase [Clostridia bacterium]|nr:N-acetylglucosamine-6-phosphate deacetylase [Clostridia bacterium]